MNAKEATAWGEFEGTYNVGTSAYDFSFTVPDGYDNGDLPLAVRVRVYQDGVVTETSVAYLAVHRSATMQPDDLAFVNFYPGKEDGIMIQPLVDSPGMNLKAITTLEFYFWGKGSIDFYIPDEDPVNLLTVDEDDYRPIISDLGALASLDSEFTKSESGSAVSFEAEVDTSAGGLSCLAGLEAAVNFFDAGQYYSGIAASPDLDVSVYDNSGSAVADPSGYIDPTTLEYSSAADSLVMYVNHFSRFVLTKDFGAPETITVGASGCDYTTIQAAVNAASPGDTILVADGTYTENVTVNKTGLIIRSANGAASTTVISASTGPNYYPVSDVSARNVTIEGFTITSVVGTGVYLNDVSTANIVDNDFNVSGVSSSELGIGCDSVTNGALFVSGNSFDGFANRALYVSGTIDDSTVEIDDNTFEDCNKAVYLESYAGYNAPADISVTNNTFDTITNSAVYVDGIENGDLTMTGNTITNCDIGVEIPSDNGICGEVDITVSFNDITNMDWKGIKFYSLCQGSLTVSDNTLSLCGDGIYSDGYYGQYGDADVSIRTTRSRTPTEAPSLWVRCTGERWMLPATQLRPQKTGSI